MGIRRLSFIFLVIGLSLISATFLVVSWAMAAHQQDALVASYAGRQRLLIQAIRIEVISAQTGANQLLYRAVLAQTVDMFEQTLNALINGGEAPATASITVTLPPTRDAAILDQLSRVSVTWDDVRSAIRVIQEADPQTPAFREAALEIDQRSPVLLAQMDGAVRLFEADADRRAQSGEAALFGLLTGLAVLAIASMLIALRLLSDPLDHLAAAAQRIGAGDLKTPVAVNGLKDINRLAQSLEDMRAKLSASAQAQAALLELSRGLLEAKDEREVANRAVELAAQAVGIDFSMLVLPDVEDRLFIRAAHGWPKDCLDRFEHEMQEGSLARHTILRGSPRVVEDLAAETAFKVPPVVLEQGIVSGMSAPMILEGQVVGAMLAHSRPRRRFGDDEIQLLSLIANQTAVAIEKARLLEETHRRANQLHLLRQASHTLTSDLRLGAVLQTLAETASRLVNARYASLAVLDAEGRLAHFHTAGSAEAVEKDFGPPAESPSEAAIPTREDIPIQVADIVHGLRSAGFLPHDLVKRTMLSMPIAVHGKVIGAIFLTDKMDNQPFSQEDHNLLVGLAADAAIAIENARLFGQVQELAITDGLTGLPNRRHFLELAEREFERARRYGRVLSAITFDVDHFKRVNDTYGHFVGDEVLRVIAARCRVKLREVDLLCRYGGEEFMALLPENDWNGAFATAERLRQCVADLPIDTEEGALAVTISLGFAVAAEDCANVDALLNQADAAMYAAKRSGRNRCAGTTIDEFTRNDRRRNAAHTPIDC